jgi:GT2 family glycosyltransferase
MKQNLFILPYVPGTAFLIDHSSYQSLLQPTFFDESYHTYWEDVDLSLKALSSGIKLSALPTWKLSHGIGKTCHKDRFYTSELFPRNRDKFRQHLEQYLKKLTSSISSSQIAQP